MVLVLAAIIVIYFMLSPNLFIVFINVENRYRFDDFKITSFTQVFPDYFVPINDVSSLLGVYPQSILLTLLYKYVTKPSKTCFHKCTSVGMLYHI